MEALDWERAADWNAAPREDWEVDGEKAGTSQVAEPLTFVTVDNAGHMVRSTTHAETVSLKNAGAVSLQTGLPLSDRCRLCINHVSSAIVIFTVTLVFLRQPLRPIQSGSSAQRLMLRWVE